MLATDILCGGSFSSPCTRILGMMASISGVLNIATPTGSQHRAAQTGLLNGVCDMSHSVCYWQQPDIHSYHSPEEAVIAPTKP